MLDFGQHEQLGFAEPVALVERVFEDLPFPERVPVSEAARRHRVLDNPGAYSGPWGLGPHYTAHLDRIMDCLGPESPFSEVGVMGPAQTGKSEIGNNWQLHTAIYAPADMLFILPDEELAKAYVKKEFEKMVEHSVSFTKTDATGREVVLPSMQERLLGGASANTLSLKRFRGADMFIYWPTGGRLRALPFPYVREDDYDEFPTDISGQGDGISLARGRMGSFSAFGKTMLYVNSTPKLGSLAGIEAFVAGGTDERLWVDCLQCAEPFALYGERLDFDRTGTPEDAAASAVVVCPACGGAHLQRDKRRLMEGHRWVAKGEQAVPRSVDPSGKAGVALPNVRAGFRLDGLFGFRTWAEIARLGREAELKLEYEQDDGAVKAWDQTVIGRNYRPRAGNVDPVTEDELAKRAAASAFVLGEVPPGVEVLVAAIDQQGNRFEVGVWGFGQGFRSWLVDRFPVLVIERDGREVPLRPFTRPEDWAAIHAKVMSRSYPLAGAPHLRMKIFNTVIDTGGLNNATDNAYAWYYAMVLGDTVSGRPPLPPTAITLYKGGNDPKQKRLLPPPTPDVKRQIKDAPQAELYIPNVNRMKNILDERLNRRDDGPGHVGFPRNVDPRHLAELRAETRQGEQWVRPPHTPNETMDLYVMAYTVVLRFGGADASLAWVPDWARPPRGGPAKLEAPIGPGAIERGESMPAPVQRIGGAKPGAKGGNRGRRKVRSVRNR